MVALLSFGLDDNHKSPKSFFNPLQQISFIYPLANRQLPAPNELLALFQLELEVLYGRIPLVVVLTQALSAPFGKAIPQ